MLRRRRVDFAKLSGVKFSGSKRLKNIPTGEGSLTTSPEYAHFPAYWAAQLCVSVLAVQLLEVSSLLTKPCFLAHRLVTTAVSAVRPRMDDPESLLARKQEEEDRVKAVADEARKKAEKRAKEEAEAANGTFCSTPVKSSSHTRTLFSDWCASACGWVQVGSWLDVGWMLVACWLDVGW